MGMRFMLTLGHAAWGWYNRISHDVWPRLSARSSPEPQLCDSVESRLCFGVGGGKPETGMEPLYTNWPSRAECMASVSLHDLVCITCGHA